MRNYLTKEGDELVGLEISEIAVKNEGDWWVVVRSGKDQCELVQLHYYLDRWAVVGDISEPATYYHFLYSISLPILMEN